MEYNTLAINFRCPLAVVCELMSECECQLSQTETMEVKGKVEEEEISNKTIPIFDEKMKIPQEASLERNWQAFKKFFEDDPKALIETFDLSKNTALHVATRSNDPKLLKYLLDKLPETDRWRALRMGNAHKNRLLHHVIHCKNVEMVDALLKYDEKVPRPPEEEIEPEENGRPLLELKNDLGETPVYRAAKYGKLMILKQMFRHVPAENIQRHFKRDDETSILHIAVIGQYFDVALWLWRSVPGIDKLANDHDNKGNGLTCLQMLSRIPSVFRSHCGLGTIEKLIYCYLPEPYDNCVDDDKVPMIGDLESGKHTYGKQSASVLSRINYAIWKIIAEAWKEIDHIWKKKKQHKLAEQLADYLVKNDYSWHNTSDARAKAEVVMPVIQPSNVAARKKAKLEKSQSKESFEVECVKCSQYTPLLLAASTGIVEIVEKIIDKSPEAIAHVSQKDEQNILHVAVKHRQIKIYKLIKRYGALDRLASQMGNKGRTLLHQVARMDYYDGGNQAGVVFQLQEELHWFERVKKLVPRHFVLFCNDDKLTATELFEIEHEEMLKEAQEWIKATAQSCSAVAVLVATVVFAAAYTVPGGTDNGVPVFLNSPLFLFFTIMDVVALASSLVSVMMFLSILTSPFQLEEFHKSLPRKLTMGFTLLFFSLTTTMLAFGSTILLTIRLEQKRWSTSLIYSITFFPVALIGLMQFPIYMAVKYRLKRLRKTLKKLVPSALIKSMKGKKKRKYSKYW